MLTIKLKQDDENALLQQALAMSMDDPAAGHDVKDTDMSEASAEDPDLALGEIVLFMHSSSNKLGTAMRHCNTALFRFPLMH